MSKPQHQVAVIIVNFRTPDLVKANLDALAAERQTVPNLSAVVVDGGSGDRSASTIAAHVASAGYAGWVEVLPLELNGGFGFANNRAIRRVLSSNDPPDLIHLLNPDAVITAGAVLHLVNAITSNEFVGAAGSQLLGCKGEELGSAFRFPTAKSEFARGAETGAVARLVGAKPLRIDSDRVSPVDWVTGASVMLNASALQDAGLFDEGFFLYFEEVELMFRLRKRGWSVLHVPESRVVHPGGASTGVGNPASGASQLPQYWFASRLRFFARTSGRSGAIRANLAWIAGHLIWRFRVLTRSTRRQRPLGEMAALLKAGLCPTDHDLLAFGTDPNFEEQWPGWMSRAGIPRGSTLRDWP